MNNQDELIRRTHQMIDELNIKANKFADTVQIGRSTLYAWWSGKLILSEATAQRIDEYLTRYGF